MNSVRHHSGAAFALIILAAVAGCGHHMSPLAPRPDAGTPTLQLKAVRDVSSSVARPRYLLTWSMKSGSADHFVYAVNPKSVEVVDASWQTTNATAFSLDVPPRRTELERQERRPAVATTFVVRAVDSRGQLSHPEQISILDDNIAPSVQILNPRPSSRARQYVPPNIEIDWQGNDPDGYPTSEPAYYKWTVLTDQSYPITIA